MGETTYFEARNGVLMTVHDVAQAHFLVSGDYIECEDTSAIRAAAKCMKGIRCEVAHPNILRLIETRQRPMAIKVLEKRSAKLTMSDAHKVVTLVARAYCEGNESKETLTKLIHLYSDVIAEKKPETSTYFISFVENNGLKFLLEDKYLKDNLKTEPMSFKFIETYGKFISKSFSGNNIICKYQYDSKDYEVIKCGEFVSVKQK